jgi:hypothetical protein
VTSDRKYLDKLESRPWNSSSVNPQIQLGVCYLGGGLPLLGKVRELDIDLRSVFWFVASAMRRFLVSI